MAVTTDAFTSIINKYTGHKNIDDLLHYNSVIQLPPQEYQRTQQIPFQRRWHPRKKKRNGRKKLKEEEEEEMEVEELVNHDICKFLKQSCLLSRIEPRHLRTLMGQGWFSRQQQHLVAEKEEEDYHHCKWGLIDCPDSFQSCILKAATNNHHDKNNNNNSQPILQIPEVRLTYINYYVKCVLEGECVTALNIIASVYAHSLKAIYHSYSMDSNNDDVSILLSLYCDLIIKLKFILIAYCSWPSTLLTSSSSSGFALEALALLDNVNHLIDPRPFMILTSLACGCPKSNIINRIIEENNNEIAFIPPSSGINNIMKQWATMKKAMKAQNKQRKEEKHLSETKAGANVMAIILTKLVNYVSIYLSDQSRYITHSHHLLSDNCTNELSVDRDTRWYKEIEFVYLFLQLTDCISNFKVDQLHELREEMNDREAIIARMAVSDDLDCLRRNLSEELPPYYLNLVQFASNFYDYSIGDTYKLIVLILVFLSSVRSNLLGIDEDDDEEEEEEKKEKEKERWWWWKSKESKKEEEEEEEEKKKKKSLLPQLTKSSFYEISTLKGMKKKKKMTDCYLIARFIHESQSVEDIIHRGFLYQIDDFNALSSSSSVEKIPSRYINFDHCLLSYLSKAVARKRDNKGDVVIYDDDDDDDYSYIYKKVSKEEYKNTRILCALNEIHNRIYPNRCMKSMQLVIKEKGGGGGSRRRIRKKRDEEKVKRGGGGGGDITTLKRKRGEKEEEKDEIKRGGEMKRKRRNSSSNSSTSTSVDSEKNKEERDKRPLGYFTASSATANRKTIGYFTTPHAAITSEITTTKMLHTGEENGDGDYLTGIRGIDDDDDDDDDPYFTTPEKVVNLLRRTARGADRKIRILSHQQLPVVLGDDDDDDDTPYYYDDDNYDDDDGKHVLDESTYSEVRRGWRRRRKDFTHWGNNDQDQLDEVEETLYLRQERNNNDDDGDGRWVSGDSPEFLGELYTDMEMREILATSYILEIILKSPYLTQYDMRNYRYHTGTRQLQFLPAWYNKVISHDDDFFPHLIGFFSLREVDEYRMRTPLHHLWFRGGKVTRDRVSRAPKTPQYQETLHILETVADKLDVSVIGRALSRYGLIHPYRYKHAALILTKRIRDMRNYITQLLVLSRRGVNVLDNH